MAMIENPNYGQDGEPFWIDDGSGNSSSTEPVAGDTRQNSLGYTEIYDVVDGWVPESGSNYTDSSGVQHIYANGAWTTYGGNNDGGGNPQEGDSKTDSAGKQWIFSGGKWVAASDTPGSGGNPAAVADKTWSEKWAQLQKDTGLTAQQLLGVGAGGAALLGSALQKPTDPVAEAKKFHDQAYGFAHTPISIKNADGTTRTFDPYGSMSIVPMARTQEAYTTNPTGADFSTNAASNPSGTVPGASMPVKQNPDGSVQRYASGGTVTPDSNYVPQTNGTTVNPVDLRWKFGGGGATPTADEIRQWVAMNNLTSADSKGLMLAAERANYGLNDIGSAYGMNPTQVQSWVSQTLESPTKYDPLAIAPSQTQLDAVPQSADYDPTSPTGWKAGSQYDLIKKAVGSANYVPGGQGAGILNIASQLDVPIDAIGAAYGLSPTQSQHWLMDNLNNKGAAGSTPGGDTTTPPAVPEVTPPPSPAGGSSGVNTYPTVAPMNQSRPLIPFKGDWLHYGEGPEHLFYNSVNPLYQGAGSIWDPSTAGRQTQSNENLDYVPPTTQNPSTVNTIGAPTNAFSQNIANGQTSPGAYAWWNYNNPNGQVNAQTGQQLARGGRAQTSGLGALSPRMQGHVQGVGSGQQDNIPAALSPGEYVMDADTVSAIGDGNTDAGAKKLDQMRHAIRKHKRAAPVSMIPPPAKDPMAYLKGGKL